MARMGLAPVLGYLIVEENFNVALGVFVLAGVTDLVGLHHSGDTGITVIPWACIGTDSSAERKWMKQIWFWICWFLGTLYLSFVVLQREFAGA